MSTKLRVLAVVLVVFLLQITLFAGLRIDGVAPELPLLLSVLISMHVAAERSIVIGFVIGLAYDLALGTPLGLWALVCCLAAYPFGVASVHLDRTSGTGLWLLSGLLSAGGIIGFAVAGAMVGRTELLRGLGHVVAIATAFNLLLSPVVGRGLRWAFASGGRARTV
ncbi:MAG TPA: rod shape-determining protein MreD [Acidimicrobiales bacterium]|nr:rod shape-determining protein MreD [Acidimicrobiales bacterium]